MMWIDPPVKPNLHLNALRAFEAAARLGGFAQAARELRVTPGAVAAQVKLLEQEYGTTLFKRHPRGVRLTSIGESLRPRLTSSFDALNAVARDMRRLSSPRRVHIATSPALAELWLSPRLPRLTELLAPISISVTAVDEAPKVKRGNFDLFLFYVQQPRRGQTPLVAEAVLPVCTPAIAAGIRNPDDLASKRCITDVVWKDWEIWAAKATPGKNLAAHGPGFSLYSIAVQQALLGAGVLIGRRSLVQQHLDSGALVAPFAEAVPLGLSIALWTDAGSRNKGSVREVSNALARLTALGVS